MTRLLLQGATINVSARDKSGVFYIVTFVKGKRVWKSTKTRKRSEAYRVLLETETASPKGTKHSNLLSVCAQEYLEHVKANFSPRPTRSTASRSITSSNSPETYRWMQLTPASSTNTKSTVSRRSLQPRSTSKPGLSRRFLTA